MAGWGPSMQRVGIVLGTALLAVAIGVLATAGKAPAQVPPATPTARTIAVAGEGEASATPDVAYVSVGVQTEGATAAEATDDNSRTLAAVLDAMRALGVGTTDLRTSGLSVLARFDTNRTTQVVGYTATNYVTVTVADVDRAGELLDAALRAGANRVSGVRFDIRDPSALRQQALTDAARSARARADAIAAGLGLHVVGVRNVQEEAYGGPVAAFPEIPAMAPSAPGPAAPPPPVQSGQQRVQARVQVVFLFE